MCTVVLGTVVPVLNGWDIKLGVISMLGSLFLLLGVLEMLVRGLSILQVPVVQCTLEEGKELP